MRPQQLFVLAWLAGCGFSGSSSPSPSANDAASATSGADAATGGSGDASCPDDDGDTICNAVDQCPGQDDRIDVDHDGIPDCKDDWLCGATKPSDPGDPVVHLDLGDQWSVDHQQLASTGRIVNVHAGTAIAIKSNWDIRVTCGIMQLKCNAQLEIGFDQGVGRDRCLFDGQVDDNKIKSGNVDDSGTIAPTPTGAYQADDLRLNIGRRTSCGTSGWDGGEPGGSSTIARVCVVK